MKQLIIIVFIIFVSIAANAQKSMFNPIPPPHAGRLGAELALVQNNIRFLTSVSASISDGTQLNGGFGVAFERNAWDDASKAYITKYFVAALGFIGTDGTKITGTAGAILGVPGTNGIIGIGPGYDFTNKKVVLITGVFIKFN